MYNYSNYMPHRRSAVRHDTSVIFPQTRFAELYDKYAKEVRDMRVYADQYKRQREDELLKATDFQYDPNLVEMNLKEQLSGKAKEVQGRIADIMRKTNYNPSIEDKMKMRESMNYLYGYQSQLLGSQNQYLEAQRIMRQNPGMYDMDYYNKQVDKMMKGEAVDNFLIPNSVDPKLTLRGIVKEMADYQSSYTEEKDGRQSTYTSKKLSDWTPDNVSQDLEQRYKTNIPFRRGVEEDFNDLSQAEKKKYKNSLDFAKNNPEYRGIYGKKFRTGVASKPVSGSSKGKQNPVIEWNANTRSYNFPEGLKLAALRTEDGKKSVKDVVLTNLGVENDGQWTVTAYIPKLKDSTWDEFKDVFSKKEQQNFLKYNPSIASSSKDPINLEEVKIPYKMLEKVLNRHLDFENLEEIMGNTNQQIEEMREIFSGE